MLKPSREGHESLHRGRECRGIDGLGQILIKARRDGTLAILCMGVGRDGRDWHTPSERRFDLADLAQNRVPSRPGIAMSLRTRSGLNSSSAAIASVADRAH